MSIVMTSGPSGAVASGDLRTVGEAIRRHADLRPKQSSKVGSGLESVSNQAL
jgi:hypothetical protein